MSEDSRKPSRRATTEALGTAPDPAPLLGGRFDLLQVLGSGSSGTVYRARTRLPHGDLPAGAEVAVKFLRQDRMHDDRARERMIEEGQLGQQVRHENVAAIHGAETIDVLGLPVTYLVMELVLGTTLRTFLEAQGPPVDDLTRRIGADAAAGLHALHRRGVVHRDIKPENLVLTPDGAVKVVDLGLARPFGAEGRGSSPSSGIGGSVSYCAPEVLRGQPAQPRSDLYSLGVVLYEVATGSHPFAHCTEVDDMLHAHLFATPAPPSHLRPRITPLLEQLLLELLQKEPDARPKDAEQVARILRQGEAGDWWRRHVERAPGLASARRLRRLRRPADTPFFGRRPEQERLDLALTRARSGHGTTVCVSGPTGIGRRRLLDECMTRWLAEGDDLLYLGGEADPGLGHGEPFAGTLLDHLLRGDSRDSPNAAQRLLHRARDELGLNEPDGSSLTAAVLGTSGEAPEVRAHALSRAILRLCQDRTVVLRIDRSEHLDTSGRLVLQRLLSEAPRHRLLLLLVATHDPPAEPSIERLDLAGLDEDDFLSFGRALFRAGKGPDGLLLAAHAVLSGSPGNLIESLAHLVQQGELLGKAGDHHGLRPEAVLRPAPGHLQRFDERVASLTAEHRRVLEAAAILGERCLLADLSRLVGVPELQALETLSLFRGRIVRAQAGEVVFRHRDFRQVMLRRLAEPARQDLHRRAAVILRERGAPPLEVGMHLSQGLDHEGCLEPLLQGLEGLVRGGSRRTSLRVAARLRVHFPHVEDSEPNRRRRLRWLLLHAEARRAAGQPDAAEVLFREANDLARTLGDEARLGAALTGMAAAAMDQGRMLGAVELLESAHAHLDPLDEPVGRQHAAAAHALHARILLYLGQAAEGTRHITHALRTAPADGAALRINMLIDQARLEALRHHFVRAQKTLRRVEQELDRVHLPRARMRLLLYRGQIGSTLDDDRAVADLRRAAEEARRLSMPAWSGRAQVFLGERAFRRGRDDEARTAFAEARRDAELAPDRLGATLAAILAYRLGGPADGLEDQVAALGVPTLRAAWAVACGARCLETGDREGAEAHAAVALESLAAADLTFPLHMRILHLAGRAATARSLAQGIAERLPDRASRRRFLASWGQRVRI